MTREVMDEIVEKASTIEKEAHPDALNASPDRQEKDLEELGPFVEIEVMKIKNGAIRTGPNPVATEVPFDDRGQQY